MKMMNEELSLTPMVACPDREEEPMNIDEAIPATETPDLPIPTEEEESAVPVAEEPMDVTQRLAEEFLVLAEEFPRFTAPDLLPDGVLEMALELNISLLDAYLRYRLQEEKKVAAAAEMRQQAAKQSAGSLSRGAAERPPEEDAFLRAFRAAL